MKPPAPIAAFGIATMLAVNGAPAQEALPQASIRVEVQMVSVSTTAALSLVPVLSDEKTIEEGNARLQKMIAKFIYSINQNQA